MSALTCVTPKAKPQVMKQSISQPLARTMKPNEAHAFCLLWAMASVASAIESMNFSAQGFGAL